VTIPNHCEYLSIIIKNPTVPTQVLCREGSGDLAILEPLTSCTACLSLVPQGRILALEKCLVAQQLDITSPDEETGGSYDSLIERLVSKVPYSTRGKLEQIYKFIATYFKWHKVCLH